MDPEVLKNTPAYLVLAYAIKWDARSEPVAPMDYYLLDFRAYQRPDQLTDEAMRKVANDLLTERFGFGATDFKLKVVEA